MIAMHNEVVDFKGNNLIKAHPDDFGYDIRMGQEGLLSPGCYGLFDTGLHIYMPRVLGAHIKARSSLLKQGCITDGTIDSGYTGSIKIGLYNLHPNEPLRWQKGDRLVQVVFYIRPEAFLNLLPEFQYGFQLLQFDISEKPMSQWPGVQNHRGINGFGSSGIN